MGELPPPFTSTHFVVVDLHGVTKTATTCLYSACCAWDPGTWLGQGLNHAQAKMRAQRLADRYRGSLLKRENKTREERCDVKEQ